MAGVFFPRDEFIRLGLSKPAVDALQKVLAIAAVEADQDALSVIVADLMAALGVAEGEIDALQAAVTAAEAAIAALVLVDVDLQGQIDAIAADALGGTVTSVTAGVGLDGGVITTSGTIDLADTAVTAGTYGDATNSAQITIDPQGRITAASNVAISGGGGGGGSYGPNWPALVVPALTDYTWVNQGTASAATDTEALVMTVPEVGTTNERLLVKTAPATPYTITALIRGCMRPRQFLGFGLVFRESSTGRLHTWGTESDSSGSTPQIPLKSTKWTNPTTYNSDYRIIPYNEMNLYWLRIADDGTNRICSVSANGKNFIDVHSVGRTDFLTADQVGWVASANNFGASPAFSTFIELLSWVEA
jgi:hypothetical protein